jgi:hypothetical protein
MTIYMKFFHICLLAVLFTTNCIGQQSLSPAIERLFNKIENDILNNCRSDARGQV